MSTYYKLSSLIEGAVAVPTTGGTTTLTASSRPIQQFTGTLSQTVVLPDATTLVLNRRFDINNRSTAAITVQDGANNTLTTIPANSQRYFMVGDISTVAGVWRIGGVNGSAAVVTDSDKLKLLAGMAGLNLQTDSIVARAIKLKPEENGANYWLSGRAPLSAARAFISSFTLNGHIYACAGSDSGGALVNTVERYNDDLNFWLGRTGITTTRKNPQGFADSKGYVVGGVTTAPAVLATNEQYDDSTNAWASKTAMTVSRSSTNGGIFDGYAHVVGGSNAAGTGLTPNEAYDTTANSWLLRGALTGAARYHVAGFVSSLYLYLTGGYNGATGLSSSEKYSNIINTFIIGPALPSVSFHASSFLVNGFGYMMSGSNNSTNGITTGLRLHFDSESWTTTAPISVGRYNASVAGAGLNGSGYAIGGTNASNTVVASVEAYRNFNFMNLGTLKASTTVPTSVLLGVLMSGLTANVPAQIRTDGENWKNFLSAGSVIKTGEVQGAKFVPAGELYWGGGSNTNNYRFDDYSNAWASRQALPESRNNGISFSVEGKSYLAGGNWTSGQTVNKQYDSVSNAFANKTPLPVGINDGSGWTIEGYGFQAGGESADAANNKCTRYDATADAWLARTALTNAHRRSNGGFQYQNTYGFVGGGIVAPTNAWERYNNTLNAWTALADITSRVDNPAGGCTQGRGQVIGGSSTGASANAGNTNYQYDPVQNSWSTKAVLPYNAMYLYGANLGEQVFVAGGLSSAGSDISSAQKYNPASNAWTSRTSIPTATSQANAFQPGPYRNYELRIGVPAFYAGVGSWSPVTKAASPAARQDQGVGSLQGFMIPGYNASTNSYAYDPSSDSWRQIGSTLNTFDNASGFSLLGYGYVSGTSGTASTTTNKLNPDTWTYLSGASLAAARAAAKAVSLDGFGWLLAGLNASSVAQTSIQKFDPSTQTWTDTGGALSVARYTNGVAAVPPYIYTVGTVGGSNVLDRFNPVTATTTTASTSPINLGYAEIRGYLGSFFSFGGNNGSNLATVYEYVTAGDFWAQKTNISVARNSIATDVFGSDIMVTGGSGLTINEKYTNSVKNAVLGMALEVK